MSRFKDAVWVGVFILFVGTAGTLIALMEWRDKAMADDTLKPQSTETATPLHLGPYRYTGARASSLVDQGMSPMEALGQVQFTLDAQFDEVVVFHGAVKFSGPVVFLGPVEWGCEDE